jgi:hypothetical protein
MLKTATVAAIFLLLGSTSAIAQGCSHSHDRDGCSERNDRYRSGWEAHYERHTRANSGDSRGGHVRDRSNWRGRIEPIHTRRSSQNDR